MRRLENTVQHLQSGTYQVLAIVMAVLFAMTTQVYADVPGRPLPGGAVPNPGTQQQELANITAPAEWNVFEFVVTCGACHAGTVDQHTAPFGNWAGGNMASATRDPIFRAAQISTNDTVKAITGQDGAGNVCFRCHSPNGWLSGRFDPALGGKPDGSGLIQSILLSTDTEGISCEGCHRAVGNVTTKRADLNPLEKVWNLLAGLFDWEHLGKEPADQVGTPTTVAGNPYGDTSLQYLEGMTYIGKYSGMTDVYFSDLPLNGSPYTGQIYAVYPSSWVADGNPMNPVPPGKPAQNSAGQYLAYNLDGTLPPLLEVPIGTPTGTSGTPVFAAQAFSIEHPTVGGAGRSGSKFPFVNNGAARNDLQPALSVGPGGSASGSEFIRTSEFCGSCHDLTVPVLNHGMPEQRTYSEWKYSSYARTSHVPADPLAKRTTTGPERCQDCHMPQLKHEYTDLDSGSYNADPWLVGGFPYGKNRAAQGGTSQHKLTGSNRDLPQIMKVLYPEVDMEILGAPIGRDPRVFPGMLSDRSPMWDRAKQNTEITLRDGVDVQITQAPTEVVGQPGVYEMKVKVVNKSGHRIPSGYPDGRRFWLSVQAKDATGAPVYVSGVYDAASATLKTTATDAFKRSLGNVIDATIPANNAVQVYERVTGMCYSDTGKTAWIYPEPASAVAAACTPSPSVLNNFILFDNRIPPKGFDAANGRLAGIKFWNYDPITFAPVEEQTRFTAAQLAEGSDEVTYRFSAPGGQALSASAEVYWQTLTREFVEHLRTADTSAVRPVAQPNPLDPNYPNVPKYLSESINGLPLSSYTTLDGAPLNDNWGGVAYAAWLSTGKGTPFLVDRDDTAVSAAPAAPVLNVRALIPSDPDFIDPVTLAPDTFAAKFSWAPVADADGYMLWIRYGKDTTGATADWDRLVTMGSDVTSHTEYVLGDASVGSPGKTYGFKVVAFNGRGATASDVVNHTIASGLPAAPSNVTASNTAASGSTDAQIQLSWFDNAVNEAGFEVWRYGPISINGVPVVYNGLPPLSIIGGSPAVGGGLGSQTGAPAIPGQTTTGTNSYTDTDGLLATACYTYQVRAFSANLDVSTFALAPNQGCTVGVRSINLSAAAASGTRVNLTWTSNVSDATGFAVKRDGALIGSVAKTTASTYTYTDTTAQPGITYTYVVEATGSVPLVVASASATTPAVPLAPSAVTAVATGVQITVSWTDNSGNEDGFVIERAPVSATGSVGAFQQVPGVGAFLAPNTLSFLDNSPLEAQTSVYRVKAISLVNGDSGYSTSNNVTVGLFAPINLAAAINAGLPTPTNVNVTVNWTDVSQKETAYRVERKIGATGAWTPYPLPADSTSLANQFPVFAVTATVAARTVQFRVTALAGTLSSQAVTTSLIVPARPNTGPRPTINGATGTTLNVNFTLPAGSVGYQLQRRVGNGAWTNLSPTLGTGAISFTDISLNFGTSYQYQVKVANPGGWSANWSNTGTGTTLSAPAAPATPTASNTGSCSATNSGACIQTVNFTIAATATAGWEAQVCLGLTTNSNNSNTTNLQTGAGQACAPTGAGWTGLAANTTTGAQSITSGGLLDNTFYSYRVRQSNAIGASNWSNLRSLKRQ